MLRKELTLREIETLIEGKLIGEGNLPITGVSSLETAEQTDAAYLSSPAYADKLAATRAGVVILPPGFPYTGNRIEHPAPPLAIERLIGALHQEFREQTAFVGIHPTAVIDPSARLGSRVDVGPHAVIDRGAVIGDNTMISAGCYIGPGCILGSNCILYPRVVLREACIIGDRVSIQAGAVLGSCGYGYVQDEDGRHRKLTQIGTVVIEDDVEIGANTCIDRARFKTTRVGRGSKVDNLCAIGHGVSLGEDNLLVAQCGIAGSTKTGQHVYFGGQVGVADHLTICDRVMVAAKSGISKSIKKPGKYNGIPALPILEYNKMMVRLRNIERLFTTI